MPILLSAEHGEGLADLYLTLRTFALASEAQKESIASGNASEQEQNDMEEFISDEEVISSESDMDMIQEASEITESEHMTADTGIELDKTLPVKIAIVGRPNVGKSTLINRIVKQERLLTGPTPGVGDNVIIVLTFYVGHSYSCFGTIHIPRS